MEVASFAAALLFLCIAVITADAKECTNIPTQVSSHTLNAQRMSSGGMLSEHYHLTPTDESAWMELRGPRKLLSEKLAPLEDFDWLMLYRSMKGLPSAQGDATQIGNNFLSEVSLHDVRIDPDTPYGHSQQTNLEYLLMLDTDRLLYSFRNQSGIPSPGLPYGGWEKPESELRGHFVGHYLSSTAQMWASTHNTTLYQKMSLVVDALYECQKKVGTGYLSAFPSEFFDRFEAIKYVWAPYYTIHKIMAGLLDQYTLADSTKALNMVIWMAEYFGNRVKNVILKHSIERHWASLNEETGGMNDVLYRLFAITNDQKHLTLAHLFDKPCFLGLLAVQADSLSGFHSNTHIPVVIGAQMRYEIIGDPLYKDIAAFFMHAINSSHSYATGGTSVNEFWSNPKRLADRLNTETEESCTTYNMLKVSRNLFRWTRAVEYADYYERALINGVLSIQRGREPGVMLYMLPMGPGQSKARSYHGWGTQFDSFWCCYGTGIESFSKLGDSIYFEDRGSPLGLYVIQFISSTFNWKSAGILVTQKVQPLSSSDSHFKVTVNVTASELSDAIKEIHLRIPSWTQANGLNIMFNSRRGITERIYPGSFLRVSDSWTSDDSLTLEFPIGLRAEAIKDDRPEYASLQAILFGPYLLAGLTGGDWDVKRGNMTDFSDIIRPVPPSYNAQLLSFAQQLGDEMLIFSEKSNSLTMQSRPKGGSDAAATATFRIIDGYDSDSGYFVKHRKMSESYIMVEPFQHPGMVISNDLMLVKPRGSDCMYRLLAGLDGKPGTVSIELGSKPGCFLSTIGTNVSIQCADDTVKDKAAFAHAASFQLVSALRKYNPVAFFLEGSKRNFLLEPLLSLTDESYTVYFNFTS